MLRSVCCEATCCKAHILHARYLRQQKLVKGVTGELAFNGAGDRLNPEYQIVNVYPKSKSIVGTYGAYKVSNAV